MQNQKKIRVLVVDDSRLSQEFIVRGVSRDPRIEVVAVAADPFEARDLILKAHPDVITCDVEMPRMNGIEFVRRLLPQYFVPVVMVSMVSNAVFEAMEAGAVDFVVKPDMRSPMANELFLQDLVQKIKAAALAKPALRGQELPHRQEGAGNTPTGKLPRKNLLIAIGASTGGTDAICKLLRALPPIVPGIVIVQHIPPVFSRMLAERLDSQTSLKVKEAQTGDFMEQGKALIAPGDRHMRVKKLGSRYQVECFEGERVNGHCPSVDVLFDSVAKEAGGAGVGILLTGMGYDGAKGLLSMRRKGCRTIGQDEASSVVYGMPKAAFEVGAVERQVSLDAIPRVLFELLG